MSDEISIKFNCRDCGELVTWDEDVSNEDVISCKGCGREFGTFGDIKAAGMRAAKDRLNDTIEDSIKDTPWVKFEKKF